MELLFQSAGEIIDTAETIIAFASALIGFLSGWFGKKKKDQIKNRNSKY